MFSGRKFLQRACHKLLPFPPILIDCVIRKVFTGKSNCSKYFQIVEPFSLVCNFCGESTLKCANVWQSLLRKTKTTFKIFKKRQCFKFNLTSTLQVQCKKFKKCKSTKNKWKRKMLSFCIVNVVCNWFLRTKRHQEKLWEKSSNFLRSWWNLHNKTWRTRGNIYCIVTGPGTIHPIEPWPRNFNDHTMTSRIGWEKKKNCV